MTSNDERRNSFGERRVSNSEVKRGSRPVPNKEVSRELKNSSTRDSSPSSNKISRPSIRPQTSRKKVEDASFSQNINEVKNSPQVRRATSTGRSASKKQTGGRYSVGTKKNKPRDNSSRFDD